jgi:hypothetical protein
MNKLKKAVKKFIPERYCKFVTKWKNLIFDGYSTKSYSQEGEDMILRRFFEGKLNGFYVDVGAHHPIRFSNTYIFYKMGWRGINIDAAPGSMKLFNKIRKRDLNLEEAILNSSEDVAYYVFDEPALNTFCENLAEKRHNKNNCKVVGTVNMRPKKLFELLDEQLLPDCQIDFLNVDVEGLDLEVLMSNNWDKYRPKIVLVEQITTSLDELNRDKIALFMKRKGYLPYSKTVNTVFYVAS